jgi:cobalt/nickel transport system permease protein
MGVLGAFVFAAQMINFQLPGLGTSGHLGGGVLLAIILGPEAATLVMAAILIVQCLVFQDGGLLALGCNIINMGLAPCFVGWGIFRAVAGPLDRARGRRIYLATWLASLIGLVAGAALVPLEAGLAGVLAVPVRSFEAVMMLLHVPIGAVEGLISFAVVAYLYRVSPAVLGLSPTPEARAVRPGRKVVIASLLAAAIVTAGALSWFASTLTDGLETALSPTYNKTDKPLHEPDPLMVRADLAQARLAPVPDYGKPAEAGWPNVSGWTSLAGVGGSLLSLVLVYLVAVAIRRRQPAPAHEQPPGR